MCVQMCLEEEEGYFFWSVGGTRTKEEEEERLISALLSLLVFLRLDSFTQTCFVGSRVQPTSSQA